ncbi:MAG: decaprenyl-phosphate phosphoribosyltransferase [Deltaproteobacteria bacterium]|nr:decaprenyl-phosphate phosphoribosyltransferase [Deltaproteobacteria bacterium]MBK8236803.1 decaprenyl-phosphate phosphoribosyltransferase [Deltaproteobacteria bacterium]MBK8720699.1 decaprenyl-phosphate phosphoribosyltransferase [Deltaproteobacteria bacterium]MBP7290511.1 decaprenyl-phosphate phosphoribosyltransferase [Nannocystaceae bacterium]
MLVALVKTLRPRQWVKNSFVAVPLFFALRLFEATAVARSLAAVALFCLISGCVYVLNDIVDAPQDRLHLQKRHRPIASGALPVRVAKTFLFIAVPLIVAGAIALGPRYAAVLGGYFVLNIAYSFRLKQIAYLDVFCIATFFIMRVLAGAFAIDVEPSHWLLACTFLLATFLGFGKRAHELAASADADKQRAALRGYDLSSLRIILHVVATAVVVTYALYTRSEHTVATFGTDALVWTVPFGVVGILRFSHLATTRHDAESPTEEMLRDPLFMANFVVYLLVTGAILYWA